nr:hypothetical protein [Bacteroides sp. UBA939]
MYFLRTNIRRLDKRTTWEYYNLIREIECTNRQLKSDLNLRPIYHRKDERADAHIFFGLLAYWIVNTIRHQLKQKGEKSVVHSHCLERRLNHVQPRISAYRVKVGLISSVKVVACRGNGLSFIRKGNRDS